MASILIRQIDEATKTKLRLRAAGHGRSMEAEAREILKEAVDMKPEKRLNLADAIRSHLGPLEGFELEIPPRELPPPPLDFGE